MKACRLLISIIAIALVSCGKDDPGNASGTSEPDDQPQTKTEPPAKDFSKEHEAIGEQVLINFEKVSRALESVSDEQTAKQAIVEIETISGDLEAMTAQMKSVGTPKPELADQFRVRFAEIQRSHLPQIEKSMQTLQTKPDAAKAINRALQALEDARSSEAFEAYGF